MQQQTYQMPNWNQLMAGWGAFANPARCPVCGGALGREPAGATPPTDWLSQWGEMPFVKEWSRAWGGLLDSWAQSMKPAAGQQQRARRQHKHEHKHEHEHCGCCSCHQADDCRCHCCVANADLLAYARLGETRVIPVTIENNVRREREVSLELSDWTTGSAAAVSVVGQVEPQDKFTLKPCEERTVVVLVRVIPGAGKQPGKKAGAGEAAKADAASQGQQGQQGQQAQQADAAEFRLAQDIRTVTERGQLPDVDACTVFYADMRIKGCDVRPVRLALAVLPRECDAYKIDCQCCCCC